MLEPVLPDALSSARIRRQADKEIHKAVKIPIQHQITAHIHTNRTVKFDIGYAIVSRQ